MLFHKPDSADLAALSAWATVLPGASASEDYAHDEMTEYGAFAPDALALCESAEGVAKVLGYCAQKNIAVTPRGAGTGLCGGAVPIHGGVVLSLVGAMLGYTVLSSESPYEAAEQGVFIKAFAKTNKKGAPIVTLVVTNIVIEAFLIIMLFSDSTYQFFYTLSAGMILLPYLLSAAYFAKVAFKEPDAFKGRLNGPILMWRILGCVGVVYSLFLSWAAGVLGVILMCLLYVPGILMYIWGKRERGEKYFQSTLDKVVLVIIVAAACLSIFLLVTTPGLV